MCEVPRAEEDQGTAAEIRHNTYFTCMCASRWRPELASPSRTSCMPGHPESEVAGHLLHHVLATRPHCGTLAVLAASMKGSQAHSYELAHAVWCFSVAETLHWATYIPREHRSWMPSNAGWIQMQLSLVLSSRPCLQTLNALFSTGWTTDEGLGLPAGTPRSLSQQESSVSVTAVTTMN